MFGCSEVNSTWLITSELANQHARKALILNNTLPILSVGNCNQCEKTATNTSWSAQHFAVQLFGLVAALHKYWHLNRTKVSTYAHSFYISLLQWTCVQNTIPSVRTRSSGKWHFHLNKLRLRRPAGLPHTCTSRHLDQRHDTWRNENKQCFDKDPNLHKQRHTEVGKDHKSYGWACKHNIVWGIWEGESISYLLTQPFTQLMSINFGAREKIRKMTCDPKFEREVI